MIGHLRTFSSFWRLSLWLFGIICFVAIGIALEDNLGLPISTTIRVGCAAICLLFILKIGSEYPAERWTRIGFWLALLVNVAIFFTPLVDRPSSRGELMLFALPDALVMLGARIVTYHPTDLHQRARRQQMILGFILAVGFCAIFFTLVLIDLRTGHQSEQPRGAETRNSAPLRTAVS
jgi:hypothetical protein